MSDSVETRGVKELVVLSGKGGTGKTSIAAALAMLADRPVVADCDVDAADLHLVLGARIREQNEFRGALEARIVLETCLQCGICAEHCRAGAIRAAEPERFGKDERGLTEHPQVGVALRVDPFLCEGCGVCHHVCRAGSIEMRERVCGEWMVSDARCGPLVHARLVPGGQNSGKLVSLVREEARRMARETGRTTIIIDGPPGIGCPAIAALGGASAMLAVTEPTIAGAHDLERVLSLARHFSIPAMVCVNRWDLDPTMAERIESAAIQAGTRPVGRIRYDSAVTRAQIQAQTVVEYDGVAAQDVRSVWLNIREHLTNK